ncbi:vitellogenin-1-like [Eublepharis macularius]|uniref:Vitellogenin-1-like n=1 Tax=Eublepharis macularius TaxID=481883 RepID=A0AA97JDY4_EUBMA|nr:vitellogenin-1-like [Eublepharis macularius]
MKVFILVLMLTLVEPGFSPNKCYTYKYELEQLTGVPSRWLSSAGIKLGCKVDICGVSPGVYRIQMYSVEVFEYNSNSPGPELHFIPSPKLTKSIAAKIENKVVAFQHKNGRVGKFMAPADYSVDGLNVHKGVVGIFQLSVKDKQSGYTLQEAGTGGICNTTYVIEETNKANQMKVMKAKNLNDCLIKVEKLVGAMHVTPCKECKERNKNSQGTITSSYYIKPTQEEAVVEQAYVMEIHQFTPFNEKDGGRILMQASQKLELIKVEERRPEELPANLKDSGTLAVHFSDESQQRSTPVKQLEHQIVDDMQYLAEHTHEKISSDCTKKFQQLVQLMHKANYELYDSVYRRCSQPSCRRIFWDVAASADNPQAIRFLKHKFEQKEISNFEAAQAVLISFHYSSPSLEFIEEAKLLVRVVHKHPHTFLFKTALLAYASLCQKYCTALNICPESVLQPVNEFATEVLSNPDDENIVLLLRTYANLQHRSVLKTFMKFMPGFATSDFSLRVRHTALLCLKSFAKKDPAWVRSISMQVFLNYKLHYSDRILAVMSLLSAKPSLPTLTILAKAMFKEPSTQVEWFFICYMRVLASSTAPDLQAVASASRMALNIVSSKYERPKYQDGRFFMLSFFKESLMAGMKTEVFILNNPGSIIPRFVSTRFETNILGNRFSPLEVGIGIQNLPEILGRRKHEPDSDNDSSVDARKLLKMQSDQKVMPREESHVGGYLQVFDQNVFAGTMDLKTVMEVYQVPLLTMVNLSLQGLYRQEDSIPWVTKLVDDLQRGAVIQWMKALTSVDASYAVPTCTGLILERSLSHVSITKLAGNAQAWFTPELPPDPKLYNIINANIRLKTKLAFSIDKRMIFRMGIRNSLLQAGLEEYVKLTVDLPIKAAVTVDINKRSYQLEIPPCKEEIDIISASSATYAVIGSVEEELAPKSTPVLLPEAWPIIIKQSFDSDSSSEESYQQKGRPYSEDNSAKKTYSAGQSAHHLPPVRQLLCLDANTFGSKTCIKYSGVHAGLIEDVPLNYFVGQHNITWTFYPVQSGPPIEKIQVTVQLGDEAAAQMVRSVRYGDEKTGSRKQKTSQSSKEESRSSSKSSSEEDENDNESSEDKTSSHDHFSSSEAARGNCGTKHSKRPKQTQSSSSSSSSSSQYSDRSRNNTSSHERSSRSSSNRDNRSEVQQEGRKKNRKHDSSKSVNSHQDEKRQLKRPVSKSGKTSSNRAPKYSDDFYDMSEAQEEQRRSLSSSESRHSSKSADSDSEDSSSSSSNSSSSEEREAQEEQRRSLSSSESRHSSKSADSDSEDSSSSSSSNSSSSEEVYFLGDTIPPNAIIKVQAVRSDNEKQGIQATVYVKSEVNKLDVQLLMVELAHTKWNMHLDVDVCPYKAKATLRMGNQGQEKILYMKVSKGHLGRKPAIQMKMKSKKLPLILRKPASKAMELIPGLAFALGFTSVYQKNPSDELVLRIAASSQQSVFVDCKVPGETFYKESLTVLPWISSVVLPQHYPSQEMTAFNSASEIALRLRRADEAVCQVDETSIRTFDNMTFNGTFNENCRTLIAQECTEKPQFTILTRKPKPDLPRTVYVHVDSRNITVIPTWNCSLLVLYNGKPIDGDLYEDNKGNVSIYRNDSLVIIKAPHQGLEDVTYDCETLWVTVSSWMRSKTCGLCGNNDGEKRNEGHMPNHELAYNDTALFHSWLLEDSDCGAGLYPVMGGAPQLASHYSILR